MSSPPDRSWRASRGPTRPPTPGPVSSNVGVTVNREQPQHYDPGLSSRLSSLDLAGAPTGEGEWFEMSSSLPPYDEYEGSRNLLKRARSRSSSITTTSSDASPEHQQGPIQHCIGACAEVFASVADLPLVRVFFSPFQRVDSRITVYKSRSRFYGWRMGILIGSCVSAAILCFNLTVVIVVAVKGGFDGDTAELPLFYGSLTMSRISSGIHILINAFSTILLAASNYTMQVLTSPTRKDLDKAHAVGQWFDIGVLSTRNLKRIPKSRLMLCLVIGLTSIPLHLFYNSAAIFIAADNDWQCNLFNHTSSDWQEVASSSLYQKLHNGQWQAAYDSNVVDYGDLYLAFNETTLNITQNFTGYPSFPKDLPADINMTVFNTAPGSTKFMAALTHNITSSDWVNLTAFIGYKPNTNEDHAAYAHIVDARARIVPSRSRIQLSLRFLIIVIVCNAIKLATMLWVLFLVRTDFVVTLGDSAATYLQHPEVITERFSVFSKDAIIANISQHDDKDRKADELEELVMNANGIWTKQYRTYSSSLDRDREIGSYFIFGVIGVTLILCVTLSVSSFVSGKWGTSSDTFLGSNDNGAQNTLMLAWLANAPQLILSFCYLAINSECTSMAGAREWNQLGTVRKGLRVTKPVQDQRSTYFLQLPYKLSLPLTVISGGLHWLLSQSIFLIRIDDVDRAGNLKTDGSRSGVGISGLSFITLCIAFYILVVGVGLIGRRRLRVRIPFAASCSLVISAACHPPSDDQDAYLRQVQWGVVEEKMFDGELHCTLSSQPVKKPKRGTRYR